MKAMLRLRPFLTAILVASMVLTTSPAAPSRKAEAAPGDPVAYAYDALGRLRAVVDPVGDTARYTYDAVGNLVSVARYASSQVSIVEFAPASGATGTSVTISGTGFSANPSQNTVTFNGIAATVSSSTSIRIVTAVPAGATTGVIAVTAPGGSATSSGSFTVTAAAAAPAITSFSPTIGVAGSTVTITGANFETTPAYNRVMFGGLQARVTSATAATLSVSVPPGVRAGKISVFTPSGQATSTADFFVPPSTYTAADVQFTGRVAIGQSLSATISTANRIGLVIFDGAVGQHLGLGLTDVTIGTSGSGSTDVYIYNPDGTILTSVAVGTLGGDLDPPALPVNGTYTIVVDPLTTNVGSATLTLSQDLAGTIIIDGPAVTTTVTTPGQNVRATFQGTAGQRLGLAMTGVTMGSSSSAGVIVNVYDPNGTLLTGAGLGTAGADLDPPALTTTGAYTILVDPGITNGNITLTLSQELAGTVSIDGSALTLTFRPGQNARATFSGTVGQQLGVGMTGVRLGTGTSSGAWVYLYQPDGTLLTYRGFGTSGADVNPPALPATGTYTILIDAGITTGNITLTLSQDVANPITIDGAALPLTIARPGQNARATFSGTVGQQLGVGMTGMTIGTSTSSGAWVYLYQPDGTLLTYTSVGTNGADLNPGALPATGTYTILIDPGITTGNITLTLSQDVVNPITIDGAALPLTIARPGQNARATFSGTVGQQLGVGMTGGDDWDQHEQWRLGLPVPAG